MSESIEQLEQDLRDNMTALKDELGALASSQDIAKHLKNTMWPFLETMVANLVEMDEVVEDIVDNADDILQPETAAVFSGVITGSVGLVAELRKRLVANWVETDQTRALTVKALAQHEQQCKDALDLIGAITVIVEDGVDDDAEDDAEDASEEH